MHLYEEKNVLVAFPFQRKTKNITKMVFVFIDARASVWALPLQPEMPQHDTVVSP